MKKNCKVEYKVVPNNSLETTRNFLIANKVINSFNAILDLNNFRLAVSELTENARKLGYFPNRIIKEEQGGKKAVFDIPSFKKIDGIKAQQEKIASRQATLFQLPENQVNYLLKSANALQSDKVRNPAVTITTSSGTTLNSKVSSIASAYWSVRSGSASVIVKESCWLSFCKL